MTTFGQKQFEELGLLEKKHTTTVRTTDTIANHPEMLTNRELEDVTAVFRSLETGLREATMDPKVGETGKPSKEKKCGIFLNKPWPFPHANCGIIQRWKISHGFFYFEDLPLNRELTKFVSITGFTARYEDARLEPL